MNCKKCGFSLTNQNKTCPNCGEINELYVEGVVQPVAPVQPVQPEVQQDVESLPTQPESVAAQTTVPVEPAPVATPVAQPIAAAPIPNTPAKKNSNIAFIIVTILLSLAIVGLGIFICIKLFGGDKRKNTPTVSTSSTSTTSNETSTPSEPTTPSETSTPSTDAHSIEIDGYVFELPSDMTFDPSDGTLANKNLIINANSIGISSTHTYDQLVENKYTIADNIKNNLSSDYTYISTTEETYDGKKYIIVTFQYDLYNLYYNFSITEFDDKVLAVELLYSPSYKSTAYSILSKFIESGEKSSTSTRTATSNDIYNIKAFDNEKIKSLE